MSIRIGIGLDVFSGPGIDADAVAFFARVTAAGGTLSATEITAINKLVKDMKAAGIWTSMKAVYPMVGASAAACAQNLISSSFTGTFFGGWTFASSGVTPNGTNAYMDTNLNVLLNISITSAHLSYYSRTNSASNWDMGVTQGTSTVMGLILKRSTGLSEVDMFSDISEAFSTETDSRGFYLGTRTSNINLKFFKNLTLKATSVVPDTGNLYNGNLYVGAVNGNIQYGNKECALASIGNGLTNTNATDLYTTVQAFQTTLSRQI